MARFDNKFPNRRDALIKLGLGVAATYAAPAIVIVSDRAAASSQSSSPSAPSSPSAASTPSAPSAPASASAPSSGPSEIGHRQAQKAVRSGRALPLSEVVRAVQGELGGKVVDIKFRDYLISTQYRLTMVSPAGTLIEVHVNAANARIQRIKER